MRQRLDYAANRPSRQPKRFQTWSGGGAQPPGAGALTEDERDIRAEILAGLIADSGGEAQISNGLVECDQ